MRHWLNPSISCFAAGLAVLLIAGCSMDDDKSKAATKPSDAALKDPYSKWNPIDTNISGGGSDALKRDVDNFWLK
jgi:hypothetical protein